MRRGVGALLLATLFSLGTVDAIAASDVAVQHASDGSVVVVGSGFRSNTQLVVGLGEAYFPAYVDSAGGFEVSTGLVGFNGDVAVHRHRQALAFTALPETSSHPLAVLFAQGLLSGVQAFGLTVVLAFGCTLAPKLARRRYPRH